LGPISVSGPRADISEASSEANRTLEFADPRPHRLGKRDSEQASAEQHKTGNGHSQETVRNEFFAHGTPPIARKIDCAARKSQLPRRHQGYLRVLHRQLISVSACPDFSDNTLRHFPQVVIAKLVGARAISHCSLPEFIERFGRRPRDIED
jgi:hypothetical protein